MLRLSLFLFCSLIPFAAFAADNIPLEITADKALEWNQTNKTYIARGNALAKQGDMSVKADILTATYTGANGSTSDISLLEANGNVTLSTATDIATGDKAVYNLTEGKAVLSGTRPKIVQDNKNTLEADQITVWTKDNALDHAEATGNVVIVNGTQTATGDKATYNPTTTIAQLIGHVKVKQGENVLEGDQTDINMTTHVSTMTNKGGTGRVKGIFYPGTEKKK